MLIASVLVQELELKARQFQMLLQPLPSLQAAPNVNALWAGALVEELCRHGIHTFGVAPGVLLPTLLCCWIGTLHSVLAYSLSHVLLHV